MAGLDFTEAAAERLERVYLGQDVTAQRADTLARLALAPGERVLDVGSGPGYLAADIARAVGPAGRVVGIDVSETLLARATARAAEAGLDGRLTYGAGDAQVLEGGVLEGAGAFDAVVSTQVAEYLPAPERFLAAACRRLRPGGRLLVIATDWDGVIWFSEDRARMARVMQAWEGHCADPRLPRRMRPMLSAAGFGSIRVSAFPLVNLEMAPGSYSAGVADFVRAWMIREGGDAGEAEAWFAELEALSAAGRYFFAS
ncbi:MAG: methyltransferase domain-containing protein, partial [Pseudomonadota bacterium]